MGLGVLDDTVLPHVPGTSDILQNECSNEQDTSNINLKYDRSGTTPILLVPQPSDAPNDPLVSRRELREKYTSLVTPS
ncbi:hypothetical protein EYZ11_012368 [Aspergillus tanneri]|uniref:Uncharacterized protein n=1 Tax=Aspergillus tanneri TaxID=1220188 RepID=A0A4S3J2I5_9EURO|nr:hypothetical protein EYZ11_012368 [Aspergillus tanneri]